jgi:hypothetical protein
MHTFPVGVRTTTSGNSLPRAIAAKNLAGLEMTANARSKANQLNTFPNKVVSAGGQGYSVCVVGRA